MSARIEATAFAVLPDGWEPSDAKWGGYHWCLRVEKRSEGRWCITDGAYVFRKSGASEYEPRPSSRDGLFCTRTRFDLDTAQQIALRLVDERPVNGITFTEAKATECGGGKERCGSE